MNPSLAQGLPFPLQQGARQRCKVSHANGNISPQKQPSLPWPMQLADSKTTNETEAVNCHEQANTSRNAPWLEQLIQMHALAWQGAMQLVSRHCAAASGCIGHGMQAEQLGLECCQASLVCRYQCHGPSCTRAAIIFILVLCLSS